MSRTRGVGGGVVGHSQTQAYFILKEHVNAVREEKRRELTTHHTSFDPFVLLEYDGCRVGRTRIYILVKMLAMNLQNITHVRVVWSSSSFRVSQHSQVSERRKNGGLSLESIFQVKHSKTRINNLKLTCQLLACVDNGK